MLVLTRRAGDGIRIGDDIKVKVLSNCAGTVRIGIQAPDSMGVHREEVFEITDAKPLHLGRRNARPRHYQGSRVSHGNL